MLNAVLIIALGVWLGAMVFFASVVAPTVFGTLEPMLAGHMIRQVFPRYYFFGLVSLSIATLASLFASASSPWIIIACTAMVGITFYAREVLMPQVNAARDVMLEAGEARAAEFKRLHQRSVQLNMVEMVVCVVVLYALAAH